MLVLTRKLGEVIRIGGAVTVRVLEVKGNQVRLGLDAPAHVKIYREEVYRAIMNENAGAALGSLDAMDAATSAVRKHKGGTGEVEDKLGR
jgi:carbon storage regulator